MQQVLLAENEAEGAQSGYTFEELGECLLSLGRGDEARPWFALAHEQLAQDLWLQAEEPDRLSRLQRLGRGG